MEAGKCQVCGRRRMIPKRTKCRVCTLKQTGRDHGMDPNELLRLLRRQRHRCAYSGRRIRIGISASVEHITARSRNGGNENSNICWVHRDINMAKGQLSLVEFKNLCQDVLRHMGYLITRSK